MPVEVAAVLAQMLQIRLVQADQVVAGLGAIKRLEQREQMALAVAVD